MRVFENRTLRNVFCIRYKVTGRYCITTSFTVYNLNKYSGAQIKNPGMGEACGAYVERKGVYGVLVGKPECNRPLGKPRR